MTTTLRASAGELLTIPAGQAELRGDLGLVPGSPGIVVFAHGSGSGRSSPRNREVARALRCAGLSTLLFDLLTEREDASDRLTGELRFDIALLAARLADVTRWLFAHEPALRVGYFGASTGAAAALVAAAALRGRIGAVVSRGGRPDLAGDALPLVTAPTLLIVGGDDHDVLRLNRAALERLTCPKRIAIVPGATHLFEEPGTLAQVELLAAAWFASCLARPEASQ